MESPAATLYPVAFFDGERDIDAGQIGVHSSMSFKQFQNLIGQKIGYAPHQISTVLVCRKRFKSPERQQKLPINDNTNFTLILNQHNPSREDCFFLVVSKKSRKERKGRARRKFEDEESGSSREGVSPPPENLRKPIPKLPPEKTLLRRDPATASGFPSFKAAFQSNLSVPRPNITDSEMARLLEEEYWYQYEIGRSGQSSPFYGQIPVQERFLMQENGNNYHHYPYPNHWENLHNREKHLFSSNFYPDSKEGFAISTARDSIYEGFVLCDLCSGSKERPVPFHFCVYDTITAGFRGPSPAGPIERPPKCASDIEAAA